MGRHSRTVVPFRDRGFLVTATLSSSAHPSAGSDETPDRPEVLSDEAAATFPHQCVPETQPKASPPVPRRRARSGTRFVGLDVARGLAVLGMVAVHTIESADRSGNMSAAWILANGKASALFAVLGGVGLAFMTGRQKPPRGRAAARAATIPAVRGALLILFGLLLGAIVDIGNVSVVLSYLGTVFLMAAVVVPLGARSLLVLGLAWTIVGPVLSQLLRQEMPAQEPFNLTLTSLGDPLLVVQTLMLTGGFPALTWFAYICIGMAIGRANLSARLVIAKLLAGGSLLALVTSVFGSVLVDGFGLRDRLADDVAGSMSLETFTNYLVFGGDGTLPADSWWWLGVQAAHTGTPLDLLFTIGTSCAVIGACLALTTVFGHRFALLSVPGSMTLTLYSLHVLLLGPFRGLPDGVHFAVQVFDLVLFALVWSRFFRRGPLEEVLRTAVRYATPASGPRPRPAIRLRRPVRRTRTVGLHRAGAATRPERERPARATARTAGAQ